MNRLEKNKKFLKLLLLADRKIQKKLIQNSNKEQIYCICEIILNLLKGKIPISDDVFKLLNKEKKLLRKIVKKSSLKNKKYLIQKGGFLQILLPTVISALSSIIGEIVKQE